MPEKGGGAPGAVLIEALKADGQFAEGIKTIDFQGGVLKINGTIVSDEKYINLIKADKLLIEIN